ncbi:MAG: hypothetical protein LBQ93_04505 [Treponema sp.]|jgi:hypothetical protein|nr:hypothetical protein [Treponema sp.]
MKYFKSNYFILFTALIFFVFSCAGAPEKGYELPISPQFVDTFEDISDYLVLQDNVIEPASDEELVEEFPLEEIQEEFLVEEKFENDPEPYFEPEEIAETGVDTDFTAVESPQQDEDEAVLSNTEFFEIPQVVQTPPVQAPPPAQAPEITQQPPAQVSSSLPPPSQTSVMQPPPAQVPGITQQSPVQVPAQTPPLPPPALLGPAEDRFSTGREDSASVEPRRDSSSGRDPDVREQIVTPSQSIIVPQNDDVVFSRIVRATAGQTVEIPFRGTGWVYLGELASRRGIVYNSRRLDPEGQSFIFTAEEAGTYALKFFKQDFIRDYILNDHVQIIVGEAPTAGSGWFNPPVDQGRVVAQPRWPSVQEEAEILRGGLRPGANTPPANIPDREAGTIFMPETVPSRETAQDRETTTASGIASAQRTPPVSGAVSVPDTSVSGFPAQPPVTELPSASTPPQPPVSQEIPPPGVLLQRAKETFDGGNVAAAIALLDQFSQNYLSTDELYWLYGQFYEANSPSRNILLSLENYRRLVNEYPQSSRYNDARRRIAYLERYYINIQ